MTEPTPPPRRPLATFLRARPDPARHDDAVPSADAPVDAAADAFDPPPVSVFDPPPAERAPVLDDAVRDVPADVDVDAEDAYGDAADTGAAGTSAPMPRPDADAVFADGASPAGDRPTTPSFLRLPTRPLPAPRWQWGLLAGLAVLLLVQMAVADRARLAADAGTRPWIAGLCTVLRCTLPAWQEPAAFSMTSRDVRPVPGQPGALQVQASFRNEARWAQAWPSLRLSLSDADGRVIGTGVFAPDAYLDRSVNANTVLEPGQSAQIAFRVREPAASTVAFTFEFL